MDDKTAKAINDRLMFEFGRERVARIQAEVMLEMCRARIAELEERISDLLVQRVEVK